MKSTSKKVLSALLALCMLIPLAACGDKSAEGQITQMEAPTVVDADGMVYVASYKTLAEQSHDGVYDAIYTDEGIITNRSIKVGTREPYEGEALQYEGQLDVYENRIYFYSYDGTETELSYRPVEPEEKLEGHIYNSYISTISETKDGFMVIEDLYDQWSTAPEGTAVYSDEWYEMQNSKEEYVIRSFDLNCNELSRTSIPVGQMEDGNYFYPYSTKLTDDGYILVAGDGGIRAYNTDGSIAYTIDSDSWIDYLIKLDDGRIFGLYYGETGYCASQIDLQKRAFGEPVYMPNDCYSCFAGGGDYDFYYTSGSNLYGFKLEEGKAEKLFSWINIDVNSNSVSAVSCDSEGNIVGILDTWDSSYSSCKIEFLKVTKRPVSEIPEKIHLTLACQYLDYNVQSMIIDYNRHSSKYHIDVLDYSEYNTEEDYSAGMTKLTTELLSGNMPDILYLNGMPLEKLAAKGLLEDLYTYIDNDPDFSRDDFFPSVLKAMELDGKLYSTVSCFSLSTVAGASSIVGDEPGWTFDEFKAAFANMPEGCSVFNQNTVQSDLMYSYFSVILPDLVYKNTGECNFNSAEFINFLNFVSLFPKDFDWEKYDWTEYEEDYVRILSGRQMLSTEYLSSLDDIQYVDYKFGGNATLVGYPVENGTGNIFQLEGGYGISSGCQNKEAAWDFLRKFFLPEYQLDNYCFPSNISAFDSKAEIAMEPQYQTDINGNIMLDENGEKKKQPRVEYGFENGETFKIYEVSAEQVAKVRQAIETTTRASSYSNDEITNIVSEESAAFLEGQKSAEEVAKLIQSKVNILINEQR